MYCVYLTIYRGNKMPPFYIGSSSVEKIQNGYHGSVCSKKWQQTWESELKDNPHLFESKIICTHETRQEAIDREYRFHKQLNVVKNPSYINQAMANKNGYFGRDVSGELHPNYGKPMSEEQKKQISISRTGQSLSEETKKKQSLSHTGENNHFYGKTHNDETKKKQSLAKIGKLHSVQTKMKQSLAATGKPKTDIHKRNISLAQIGELSPHYGKIRITNGVINKFHKMDEIIPEGWRRGVTRRK